MATEEEIPNYEYKIVGDCRDWFEKKKDKEFLDPELHLFLTTKYLWHRRAGYCDVIDIDSNHSELTSFRENLLREDYIENYLL